MISIRFRTLLLGFIIAATATQLIDGQIRKGVLKKVDVPITPVIEAAVSPVVIEGNVMCSDLNASTDPRFAYITSDNELKLNLGDPNGNYEFVNGTNTVVVGPEHPGKFVTIASGNATVSSWSSDIAISAVVVKVGSTSYVYPYDPSVSSDTNLATGDNRGISHVSFCYQFPITAAHTTISGRALNAYGRGISGARIQVLDLASGQTTYALTNSFGYYTAFNLEVGRSYILSASSKSYTFYESSKMVSLLDATEDVNFIANP